MQASLSAARAWLARNTDGLPPALHARMLVALEQVQAHENAVERAALEHSSAARPEEDAAFTAGVSYALAAAALVCLREALVRCDERPAAFDLLAADALITAACEVAATVDAGAAAGGGDTIASEDRAAGADMMRELATLCEWYSAAHLSALVSP